MDDLGETSPEALGVLGAEVWERSPDGLAIVDEDGTIVAANPVLHRLLGYEPGSLISASVERLVPAAVRTRHRRLRAAYNDDPVTRPMGAGSRLEAEAADGSAIPVHISLAPCQVGGRTMALAAVRDMTDSVLAEDRLAALNLKRLVAEDRERIARDLHDTVIQELFALGLTLQGAIGQRADDLDDRLGQAVETVDDIITSIRRAVFAVTRRSEQRSVRTELLDLVIDRAAAAGFDPDVSFHGPLDELPDQLADDLLAVVGEAVSNAVRHADAATLDVKVSVDPLRLVAEISDDGVGIAGGGRRSGLANLAERAARRHGRMELDTAAGKGTLVRWMVPLRAGEEGDRDHDRPG